MTRSSAWLAELACSVLMHRWPVSANAIACSIVSQRLLPREEGKGRIAAVEILLNTPLVSDLIFKGEVNEIKELMKRSRELGMQTFDQSLFDLYENQLVTYEDAIRNADSVNDLRLQVKLHSHRARNRDLSAGTEHLTIM